MDDYPIYTIPNQHPTKMDVLLKTFVQIILADRCLVWHSRMPRRPLPSLLSILLGWVSVVPVGYASVPVPVRTGEHLLDIRLLNLQKGEVHSLVTMLITPTNRK